MSPVADNLDKTVYFNFEEERFKNELADKNTSAILTVFDGISEPVEFNLYSFGKDVVTFGRGGDNDINLKSRYVSRQHGQFELSDKKCVIKNNPQSTNGLIFNNKPIQQRRLSDGYSVRIDDGVETTQNGVLFIFFAGGGAVWETVDISQSAEITIGRQEDCDIHIDHSGVSRVHAKIVNDNGVFRLIDNKSRNGVTVNGEHIAGEIRLREKDLIFIANSRLVFTDGKISYSYYKNGVKAEDILKMAAKKAEDEALAAVDCIQPAKEETETEITDEVKISDDTYSFQFMTGGVIYRLPCAYFDFAARGWSFQDEQGVLNPFSYDNVVLQKDNVRITANLINMTVDGQAYENCFVGGLKIENFSWRWDTEVSTDFFLPGGIQYGVSSAEDIIAAYGEPSDRYEFSSDFYGQKIILRYTYAARREIELQIAGDKLNKIDMINYTAP